ncbi:hypothetical protein PPERSA_09002 [Pseudocohnilembus persalinus]|uniref:Uncharacterized protein n=1 Tax=Pseudocohnilembus persalinus TaxID=266149 RepID=A0A0V0R313_PSEPJ|nr:hypothetical protein PPERSA_09002 [Pseudocohnilembus persalinus]|eukprot:KRX08898.1 hypothetical protein PPERSA_09002 [Pseudocohnilembus persalinus]
MLNDILQRIGPINRYDINQKNDHIELGLQIYQDLTILHPKQNVIQKQKSIKFSNINQKKFSNNDISSNKLYCLTPQKNIQTKIKTDSFRSLYNSYQISSQQINYKRQNTRKPKKSILNQSHIIDKKSHFSIDSYNSLKKNEVIQFHSEQNLNNYNSPPSWIRNLDEELTNDRRDLILLQGKVNTLEIHTKYEVEQFRKLTDVDAKRLQSQMDQGFQNQRQNHFDLKKQVNEEESHHKQQKKEIIQIQKKIGSMEQEIGPGNIKKSQERQLKLQQIKQSKMEETLTQHPDVSFINNNNTNNSTFLNNESLINNTFQSVLKSGFITQN